MSISVTLEGRPIAIELNAKRTLGGDIMIFDHEDMDIILVKEQKKCLLLPKEEMSDKVYASQDRLCKFLVKHGVANPESIRGGNIYGSMEVTYMESKIPGIDPLQATLFGIYEHLKGEKPYFGTTDKLTDDYLDHVLRPSDEFSTDLGDVPHSAQKGSMDSRVRSYGYMYNYSLMREQKEEEK